MIFPSIVPLFIMIYGTLSGRIRGWYLPSDFSTALVLYPS